MHVSEEQKPRRRQARGERRVTQLLEAAAKVFCLSGYTASSTNAIAREAGVSPGTLYQFFPNKEAIAVELGDRLFHEMEKTHGLVFTAANAALPLGPMIDAIVDPFIEFNHCHPVFFTLIKNSDGLDRVAEEHAALHASLLERVSRLIALRTPALPTSERLRIAEMAFAVFKGGLEVVLARSGAEQAAYTAELKGALYRYLAPHIGTEAVLLPGGD